MYFFPAWLWRILELLQVVLSPTSYMYDQLLYVVSTVRSFAWSSKGKADYTTAKVKWEFYTFPFIICILNKLPFTKSIENEHSCVPIVKPVNEVTSTHMMSILVSPILVTLKKYIYIFGYGRG
jgi:hypothetical protein